MGPSFHGRESVGLNKTYLLGEKRSYHDGKNLDRLAGEGNLIKIIRNFTVIGAILT